MFTEIVRLWSLKKQNVIKEVAKEFNQHLRNVTSTVVSYEFLCEKFERLNNIENYSFRT